MYCPKCGSQMTTKSRYCSSCGRSTKKAASKLIIILTILMALICITVFIVLGSELKQLIPRKELATEVVKDEPKKEKVEQTKVEPKKEAAPQKQPLAETPKDVSTIINTSQPKVFTILTELGQGSGFLINKNGDVLTNAHVVEGSFYPIVKTIDGKELQGTLIGYSNTIDIAVIRVPELVSKEPLLLEESAPAEIGEEVIALGSPQGFENTATLGNISGVDRTFIIEPFQYNGIYQTSAPIAPGSSGGPLLNKATGKVIAINSARHTEEINIGFSIPLYQVMETINQWIASPMTEDEITELFYYQEGMYYYQDYMDDYGYFEGGDYNEEYYEYYEVPYDESWYEEYYEYWDDSSLYEEEESYGTEEYYEYEDEESYGTEEYYEYEDEGSYGTDEYYEEEGSYESDEYLEYEESESYGTDDYYENEDLETDQNNEHEQGPSLEEVDPSIVEGEEAVQEESIDESVPASEQLGEVDSNATE